MQQETIYEIPPPQDDPVRLEVPPQEDVQAPGPITAHLRRMRLTGSHREGSRWICSQELLAESEDGPEVVDLLPLR